MKNIYMFQMNIPYPNGTYLPYAAGTVAAYALSDPFLKERYALEDIFCVREAPETLLSRIDRPDVAAFSCYVWNYEHCKKTAALIKEKYPECAVIFGGHNIPNDSAAALDECPFADYLIFGEGERGFRDILMHLEGKLDLNKAQGLAFREDRAAVVIPSGKACDISDYPSPYAMGFFDRILERHPDMDFSAILETNRGCPYSCAYCDWCEQESRVRSFPWERIRADLDWMAAHRIEFCYCSDANFGILKRDEQIIDLLVEYKEKYGYPKKFRVNFAKHNNELVFRITQKLEKFGLNKGATISFQSMTPAALKNIGRENMPIERFSKLMSLYRGANITTYSEIILGLPGESLDDFRRGIGSLLAAGQHTTVFIYNCELIENSVMAKKDYIERYKIEYAVTPLRLRHNENRDDGAEEKTRIVVGTDAMSRDDWVSANLFAVLVQACHSMGLLRCFALYLYNEKNVPYEEFYMAFHRWAKENPDTAAGRACADAERAYSDISRGRGAWTEVLHGCGTVSWPLEEAFYIKLLREKNVFYDEISGFLSGFDFTPGVLREILDFQRLTVKYPGVTEVSEKFSYDWTSYFKSAMTGVPPAPVRIDNVVSARDDGVPADWAEFSEKLIWFGRTEQKNLFSDLTVLLSGF